MSPDSLNHKLRFFMNCRGWNWDRKGFLGGAAGAGSKEFHLIFSFKTDLNKKKDDLILEIFILYCWNEHLIS